jgi:hypothetical protein
MKNLLSICLIGILCCACAVSTITLSTPTNTVNPPTQTVTPTIVWFPPTATPTAFPTPVVTPTADMRPNTGKILLEDDFSDPSAWTLDLSELGSVALGKNELTIAIGETNAYLYSVRESPIFTNFYLEITAEPNLCSNLDEYGVLIRVSLNLDYYRFSLSCNGQVRLDRVIGGQASSPQPWMMSGSVPPGAPSVSRIGISAQDGEMELFVNGQYQFTIHDPLLTSGGVGVFARSTNNKAVTVNFSDLVVYEINP